MPATATHKLPASLALAGLALLATLHAAAPLPPPAPVAAAPVAQDMVWVVEQIELRKQWAGFDGDGTLDFVSDRQLFDLSETVTNGPRTVEGGLEMLVPHPNWIEPGARFDMRAEASGILDSRGEFGVATPSASLNVEVRCETTVPRRGTCGGAEQKATGFESLPNAQNRTVSLSASAEFPGGTWTAPPEPTGIDAWVVGFGGSLVLSSTASYSISGRIWYRYAPRPAAPPLTITGRVFVPRTGDAIIGVPVEARVGGSAVQRTISQTPDGRYTLVDLPSGDQDLVLRATLTREERDPASFTVRYGWGALRIVHVDLKPGFDVSTRSSPVTIDIPFDAKHPLHQLSSHDTLPMHTLDDYGVIYARTREAALLGERLGLQPDYSLPVDVHGFYTHLPGASYLSKRSSDPPAAPPIEAEIFIGERKRNADCNPSMGWGCGDRPDNTEWHEFGHHVMADAYGNRMPHNPTPPSVNHKGYANHGSTDSWVEGFATFYSSMVSREMATPEAQLYDWAGGPFNLEAPNALAWGGPEGSREDMAVGSLLWDLVDPKNIDDFTEFDDERYADCVEMPLQSLWDIIARDQRGVVEGPPPAKDQGFGFVYDVMQLYEVLEREGVGQSWENGSPVDDLDALFVMHGFFADTVDLPKVFVPGEEVGRTADAARPNRRARPIPEGSFLSFDGRAEDTGRPVQPTFFEVELSFAAPYEGYGFSYPARPLEVDRLAFTLSDEHYRGEARIKAWAPGYVSSEPLTIASGDYWQAMAAEPERAFMHHSFNMRPTPSLYLPQLLTKPAGAAVLAEAGARSPGLAAWSTQANRQPTPPPGNACSSPTDTPTPTSTATPTASATYTPTPTFTATPSGPIPMRVDADHVYAGLDARLTVGGHFFAPGASVMVGTEPLEDLEYLGLDPEPPHYHRLRGNLDSASMPQGSYDLTVSNPSGAAGGLPDGFVVLGRGTPAPPADPPIRCLELSVVELGRSGPRTAFLPGDPILYSLRMAHEAPERAPAVLIVELHGPEGRGERSLFYREDFTLPASNTFGHTPPAALLPASLEPGEYTLAATVKAYGKQVEHKIQLYVADRLIISDGFEREPSGWPTGRLGGIERSYFGNEYRLLVSELGILGYFWQRPWREVTDFVIEADARSVGAALAERGLALDVSSDNNQALWFRVSNTGQLKLTKRAGDVQAHLMDWTYAPQLAGRDGSDHLMAVRRGKELRLYAGGARLRTFELVEALPGWAGVLAGSFDDPVDARFDNFKVFQLR